MLATRVHHVSFAVSDLARARRFYEEILGAEEIERPDFGVPGVWFQAANVQIHLIETPEGVDVGRQPEHANPIGGHTAFAIEDYEKTRDGFRSQGVDVLETNPEVGQMWIRDPDGHLFEFIVPRDAGTPRISQRRRGVAGGARLR